MDDIKSGGVRRVGFRVQGLGIKVEIIGLRPVGFRV